MTNWKLSLLVAAAALSLQACDVTVHEAPKDRTASTGSDVAPAPAANPDAKTPAVASTVPQEPVDAAEAPVAGASSPAAASTAAAPASADTMAAASQPQQPGTNEMGGPAASTPASTMPADTTAQGVAAPTELARFFQDNPIPSAAAKADPATGSTKAKS